MVSEAIGNLKVFIFYFFYFIIDLLNNVYFLFIVDEVAETLAEMRQMLISLEAKLQRLEDNQRGLYSGVIPVTPAPE